MECQSLFSLKKKCHQIYLPPDIIGMRNDNTPPLSCKGQITVKIGEMCLTAIQNQTSTISMYKPSLVKIHWHLLVIGNESTEIRYDRHTDGHSEHQGETRYYRDCIGELELGKMNNVYSTFIWLH